MTRVVVRRAREAPFERNLVEDASQYLGLRSLKLALRYDAGWPDRLWLLPAGRTFWTELKAPGKPLAELQHYRMKFLRDLGHDVAWFDNYDAACAALKERVR